MHWYIAAAAKELKRKPVRRKVEGATVVLFRDSKGQPHAITDRCAHRGMRLSEGEVAGDCVVCPYHGWQYDGAAQLKKVPALCGHETLPQAPAVRSYPVQEQDGQLWIYTGKGEPDSPPFHFPHCGDPGWHTFFMQTRFEAPVEACLENFLDVPHTIYVHPGLFRSREKQQPSVARVRRRATSVEAEFVNEKPLEGLGPRLFFPRNTKMRHTDEFLLPSITHVTYAFGEEHAFLITSQCTSREEFITDVTTAITWRLPAPAWLVGPFARWYCRRVIQQDVDILKSLGQEMQETGAIYTSTAADLLGVHIRGLRKQMADGSLPKHDTPGEVVETELRI